MFKRKSCKHYWELNDYYKYVTEYDVEELYVIRCSSCFTEKPVSEDVFNKMYKLGLIGGYFNEINRI